MNTHPPRRQVSGDWLPPLAPKSSKRPSPPPPWRAKKRAQVSVACNTCRGRKLKCSADRPFCAYCRNKDLQCVYEADPDQTRTQSLKHKNLTLQAENEQLSNVIDLLRFRPIGEAQAIFDRLRNEDELSAILNDAGVGNRRPSLLGSASGSSGSAVESSHSQTDGTTDQRLRAVFPDVFRNNPPQDGRMRVSTLLTSGLIDGQEAPGPSTQQNSQHQAQQQDQARPSEVRSMKRPGNSKIFRRGLLANHQSRIDERLEHIQTQPWTTVRVKATKLANLISLYLSWHHKLFPLFVQDLFLTGLVSESNDFCSPALVNSICGFTCASSSYLDPDLADLQPHFLEHAHQCLLDEERHDSIAVAAWSILGAANIHIGEDELGSNMMKRASQIAEDVASRGSPPTAEMSSVERNTRHSRSVSSWGFHCLCTHFEFFYAFHIRDHRPSLPALDLAHPDPASSHWEAWPRVNRSRDPIPPSRYGVFCTLIEIVYSALALREGSKEDSADEDASEQTDTFENALGILQRMSAWSETIPNDLKRWPESPPHVLELHVVMLQTIAEICRPFVGHEEFASQIFSAANQQLRIVVMQTRGLWGGPPSMAFCTPILDTAARQSLTEMQDDPEQVEFFTSCVQMLAELSNSAPMVRKTCRALLDEANSHGIDLPGSGQAIRRALKDQEEGNEVSEDFKEMMESGCGHQQRKPTMDKLTGDANNMSL